MAIPEHVPYLATATAAATTVASEDQPGSGYIPSWVDFVVVTSASSANFIVLNSVAIQGKRIWGTVGANGFKLQTFTGSAQTINNVNTATTAVAVIPANATFLLVKSLTTGWILTYYTNLGAVGTAIVPA